MSAEIINGTEIRKVILDEIKKEFKQKKRAKNP